MNYLAHISVDGREQSVEDHLYGTAKLCGEFAEAFGAEEQGWLLGALHDVGKYSDAFRKRLHGGPKVDHATAGAIESARLGAEWGAFCIAGHHSGIPNGGNWKSDASGDPTLIGRLKKGIAGQIPPYRQNRPESSLPATPLAGWGKEPRRTPHGVRGLKFLRHLDKTLLRYVAPRTGCASCKKGAI